LKSSKERNKEDARNYRIKKRIRNQDLETEVELLKKKIALLEEELKCLPSLGEGRRVYPSPIT
jgi:hypothetical protein